MTAYYSVFCKEIAKDKDEYIKNLEHDLEVRKAEMSTLQEQVITANNSYNKIAKLQN
jgi:hypothetical protein